MRFFVVVILFALVSLLFYVSVGEAGFEPGLCLCNDKSTDIPQLCAFFCDDEGISLYNVTSMPGQASCQAVDHCDERTCQCEGDNDCYCCEGIPMGKLGCEGCSARGRKQKQQYCCKDEL